MNAEQRNSGLRKLLPLAVTLGIWAGLVVLFASQFLIVGSLPVEEAFRRALYFWGAWALFLPVVVWLSYRFPVERKRLFHRIAVHLLASVLVVTAGQIVLHHFTPFPGPLRSERSPKIGAGEKQAATSGGVRSERSSSSVPGGFAGFRAGFDIFIYLAALSVCHAIAFFRHSEQRERRTLELESRLAHAQLHALRMQINPHFLFNTLNAISTLVHTDPNAADEMITDLSELLRISLDSSDEQEIPLSREIEFLRCYLDIERTRFGERLRIEQNIPLEVQGALVPTLILQPLVENAIRHGIEPQRQEGVVTISARREGDALLLAISDNGRGMNEVAIRKEKSGRGGIGLKNTRERLEQLYGPGQSFRIGRGELGGCLVELKIPLHFEPVIASALAREKES